jgi:NAD(P)-dependent dehydrogenase (short-subunit alcohol dehydrogenase family)
LVTGASRGIGRSIAERLARDGARLVLASRSSAALEELAAALPGSERQHLAMALDVGDAASVAAMVDELEQRALRIDVLVNNAGIAESKPYHRTDDELWERTMAVNATGVFRLCRALLPPMVEAGWGRCVIVASNAGLTGYGYSSAYCASKHAVIGMMRAVALEIARSPVTINAVCPGWVDTEMARGAVQRIADKTGRSYDEAQASLVSMSPQRRMVQPEEVAQLVAALCDDGAASIHGQAIPIDGGQVMK